MGRRHRSSKADRKPVTRRYVLRTVQRARDDIIRALIFATAPADEPIDDARKYGLSPLGFLAATAAELNAVGLPANPFGEIGPVATPLRDRLTRDHGRAEDE